jgi:hypothetical protein
MDVTNRCTSGVLPAASASARANRTSHGRIRTSTNPGSSAPPGQMVAGSNPAGGGIAATIVHTRSRSSRSVTTCAWHSATATSCFSHQYEHETYGVVSMWPSFGVPERVVSHPVSSSSPSSQTGWTMRERGRPDESTVQSVH